MPPSDPCRFSGCAKLVGRGGSHGLCDGHAKQLRRGEDLHPLASRSPRPLAKHPSISGALLVPLTQGQFAIIDEADGAVVGERCWSTRNTKAARTLYAQTNIANPDGTYSPIKLHRFLWEHWGLPDCPEIDHKNTNGLDCRRENLRPATKAQNAFNRGRSRANKSGIKGVSRHSDGKWQVHVGHNGKTVCLGLFGDKEEAGRAYAEAAARLHGDFARTE